MHNLIPCHSCLADDEAMEQLVRFLGLHNCEIALGLEDFLNSRSFLLRSSFLVFVSCVCVCVCVNLTSGGERSLATPAYQGRLALIFLPLGAAVNKIKSATRTLPNA
jgi:hypothetical protein